MLFNIDAKRITKLSKYIELADEGFVVLETSEMPIKLEIISELQKNNDILLIDFIQKDISNYKEIIDESKSSLVIMMNLLYKYRTVQNVCREINGSRDIYKSFNKVFLFILEPCIVDYLISNCMSFWSCVVLHEDFNTLSFNPFSPKTMMSYRIQKTDNKQIDEYIKTLFCEKFNCNKNCDTFTSSLCYYYSSINEGWSDLQWINSCVKLGDYFFRNSEFERALYYYDFARNKISSREEFSSSNYIRWRIATTLCELQQYEKASIILLELIESEDRIIFSAQLKNDLGVVLLKIRDDSESIQFAYKCFKESQEILEKYEIGDTKDYLKKVYYNLALFHYNSNNLKCCMDYVLQLDKLQSFSTQNNYDYYFFSQFIHIKYGLFDRYSVQKSSDFFNHHVPSFEHYYIDLYIFIYSFYLFSNNAIGSALKSIKKINKPMKNEGYINRDSLILYANSLYLQGVCLFYLKDNKKSITFFSRAIDYFERANDKRSVINIKKIIYKLKNNYKNSPED